MALVLQRIACIPPTRPPTSTWFALATNTEFTTAVRRFGPHGRTDAR